MNDLDGKAWLLFVPAEFEDRAGAFPRPPGEPGYPSGGAARRLEPVVAHRVRPGGQRALQRPAGVVSVQAIRSLRWALGAVAEGGWMPGYGRCLAGGATRSPIWPRILTGWPSRSRPWSAPSDVCSDVSHELRSPLAPVQAAVGP
nr:hypothetical protein [Zoogloea sp.]